ncbi:thioredoxin family protein, partial [Blautia sp.]
TKACCCGGNGTSQTMRNAENKKREKGIKILGSGCAKCMELERATRTALSELQLNYEVEHITDFAEIASYGVMATPAFVLDGEVISYGKVLTVEEVKVLLTKK